MKDNKRADRRAHNQRIKNRSFQMLSQSHHSWMCEDDEIEMMANLRANNMQNCSCWMCGNPRKFCVGVAELTIQERKHIHNLSEGVDEYYKD
jgi:hypothetical protein